MRVGVDARALAAANRGVAHYTDALVGALAAAHPDDRWLMFVPGRGRLARGAATLALPNVELHRHPLPGRPLFGSGAVIGRPRLDRLMGGGLDVLWAPAPVPLAFSAGVPFVLTLHDLSFVERPGDFTPYERLWHRLARVPALVAGAQRVMVDSTATGDLVADRWDLPAARIAVVRAGVSRPREPVARAAIEAVRQRHGLPERYLLAVGALEPRKAPVLLMRAHARARADGLDAALAFAGTGRLARRLHGPGVHLLGHVPDADLDALYAGALALVMPSLMEGYGLPPLEAAARGTPAVVSDLAVYRETLGDAALQFPVGDEEALARALVRIAADAGLRERLARAAASAIVPLTWEAAARPAHAVLAEAACP